MVQPQWPPRSRGPLGYFEIINHENSFGACEFVTSCHSGEQDGGKLAVLRATSLSPRKLLWGAGSVTWVFQLGVPGVKLAPRSPRGPRHLSPGVWGSRVCSAPFRLCDARGALTCSPSPALRSPVASSRCARCIPRTAVLPAANGVWVSPQSRIRKTFRLLDMSPEVSAVSAEPESHSGTGGAAGPRRFAGHLRRGPQRPGRRTCGSSVWRTVGQRASC